jgi:hypothetical protein
MQVSRRISNMKENGSGLACLIPYFTRNPFVSGTLTEM